MLNLILQKMVTLLTTFALFINSIGGLFGVSAVIPYNPERTEIVVSGEITTDVAEILDYYNSAVKKTGFVIGKTKSDIIGTPTMNSNGNFSVDMSAYWDALEATETYVFEIPGNGNIIPSDVKSAKMSVNDGKRVIILEIKDVKSATETDGALSRAYGWTSNASDIYSSFGMEIEGGEIKESYTDNKISCVIDEKSGKIIYGDWDSTGTISMKDVNVTMKFLEDYSLTISMDCTTRSYIDV